MPSRQPPRGPLSQKQHTSTTRRGFVHNVRDARVGERTDDVHSRVAVESFDSCSQVCAIAGRDGAGVQAQSCYERVGQLHAGEHEKDGAQGSKCERTKGRAVVTWILERTTWFGYVAQSEASPDCTLHVK